MSSAALFSNLPKGDPLGFGTGEQFHPEKVRERDANLIVLDHNRDASAEPAVGNAEDDAYYAQFKVPDDLAW